MFVGDFFMDGKFAYGKDASACRRLASGRRSAPNIRTLSTSLCSWRWVRREDDKKLKCPRGHPEATGSLPMAKMLRLAAASQAGVALRRIFEPDPRRIACGDGSAVRMIKSTCIFMYARASWHPQRESNP